MMEHDLGVEQQKQGGGKWTGKVKAKLKGASANQVWPFFEDYCNFHKWHPGLDVCQLLDGVAGLPGCVRYCAGGSTSSSNNEGDEKILMWVKEKLLVIDPIRRTLTYEIIDSNSGFGAYETTFAVLAEEPSDDGDGCSIEWSFVADSVEGWTQEALVSFLDMILQGIAKKMEEDAFSPSH